MVIITSEQIEFELHEFWKYGYKPEKTDFTRALKKTGKTEINWPFVLYSSDSGGTPCRQSCNARSMTSSTGRRCVFLGWLHLWFLPADRISLVTTDFYRLFVQPTHLRSLEQRACVVCKRNRVSIQKTASLTRWLIHLNLYSNLRYPPSRQGHSATQGGDVFKEADISRLQNNGSVNDC